MKMIMFFSIFLMFTASLFAANIPAASVPATTKNDPQAYIVYQQGNEMYKVKKYDEAKTYYLQLINQYPESKFVPYAVYMLSFMETDYIRIIDYLTLIKDEYQDFRYWTNTVEKLGDIFYVMGNHPAAVDQYKMIRTDRSLYMLSLIYSADNFSEQALDTANKLLIQTTDNSLAYKTFIILAKIYLEQGKYAEAYPYLQQAIKLRSYAFDNGARILYYSGKYYYGRKDILNHNEKSLYIFSLLKTNFPLSVEATMATNYIENLRKINVTRTDEVRWVADAFVTPAVLPFQSQPITPLEESEQKAEKIASTAEGAAGNMVKADLIEYVVRIGEYKDLSVANLAARDIVKHGQSVPLGIYYRNDLYYAEIRGIKTVEEAKVYAKKMIAMGYTDTKVVEFMKVVEFNSDTK